MNNNLKELIEANYEFSDNGEYSYLSVLLTPMEILKTDERYTRASLYKNTNRRKLEIIHNKFNEEDSKTLDVYNNGIFIGYVRKKFTVDIDKTDLVNNFCFNNEIINDITLYWTGGTFMIQQKSLLTEKNDFLKKHNIYDENKDSDKLFIDNKEVILKLAIPNPSILKYVDPELKNDKVFVLKIVKQNGGALSYLSNKFKDDEEVVLLSLQKTAYNLAYASNRLKANKDIVLQAMSVENLRGYALSYVSENLKDDKEVALVALSIDYRAIRHVSDRLKDDKDVIMKAVENFQLLSDVEGIKFKKIGLHNWRFHKHCNALNYASDRLRDDKEVVIKAISNSRSAFEYASERIKNDKTFILLAIEKNPSVIRYMNDRLKDDKEVILMALSKQVSAFTFASENIKNDKAFVLELLKKDRTIFKLISEELQQDKDILEIMKKGSLVIDIVDKILLNKWCFNYNGSCGTCGMSDVKNELKKYHINEIIDSFKNLDFENKKVQKNIVGLKKLYSLITGPYTVWHNQDKVDEFREFLKLNKDDNPYIEQLQESDYKIYWENWKL